jgi:putative acetyltransferase
MTAITVRPLRPDEGRTYLEIINSAIRELAAGHYSTDVIREWVHPTDDASVSRLMRNQGDEIRLIAELDGRPDGIGALVVSESELRACYVAPEAARRGVGSAIVGEIEHLAREHGLACLKLVASINAEPFYAACGYLVRRRGEHVLRSGRRMPAVWMEKDLTGGR